ncbi:MAG: lipooligosaccharide biosynthesis protein LpsA [Bacteroidales bacterium]|jgi:glycosyl transferase family 25|nr:lipooligosaccharide biosynthesis protein LpsA [Bacteroidales bacterium]
MRAIVIHARSLTEREKHIRQQLKDWSGDVTFMSDVDKDEITEDILAKYFKPACELYCKSGQASCAVKHLMALQYIIDNELEGALVLEDDIVLHTNFVSNFMYTMEEYRNRYVDKPVIISYEDSSLQFVPHSRRIRGQWLYEGPTNRVRFNGALYINNLAARVILAEVMENKCDRAIDHFYVKLHKMGLLTILWCEPALATQGSFNGKFLSSQSKNLVLEGCVGKLNMFTSEYSIGSDK